MGAVLGGTMRSPLTGIVFAVELVARTTADALGRDGFAPTSAHRMPAYTAGIRCRSPARWFHLGVPRESARNPA